MMRRSVAWILAGPVAICLILTAWVAQAAPGDVQFERAPDTQAIPGFPPAIFPHWIHRIRYRCDACHNQLFEMQKGGTVVTMENIGRGETCGKCHNGTEAFVVDFQSCTRCHTEPAE